MKILVCIKQVPDMESKFALDGSWYDTTELVWRMNEYDEYGVEQAVRLKEQVGDADLTVLCIGPDRVKETMKKALAMGCDRGMHISDDDVHGRDPFEIAQAIGAYARKNNFDLIFCGMQSQDRASGQVGILVAEILNIPGISTVVDFSWDNGTIQTRRELEGGIKAVVSSTTPALITCQLGLNTPRYPTLPNIMKAKKKELVTAPIAEYLTQPATQVTEELFYPEKKGGGLVLEGEPMDLAAQLVDILRQKTTVIS